MGNDKSFFVAKTNHRPEFHFNASAGLFTISGNSIPENAYELYMPVLEWLDEYTKNPAPETVLCFKLNYFNSSSTEYIVNIIKKLGRIPANLSKVKIVWEYDNEDDEMYQIGQDLASLTSVNFELRAR